MALPFQARNLADLLRLFALGACPPFLIWPLVIGIRF
jgi:hypothetical protein